MNFESLFIFFTDIAGRTCHTSIVLEALKPICRTHRQPFFIRMHNVKCDNLPAVMPEQANRRKDVLHIVH